MVRDVFSKGRRYIYSGGVPINAPDLLDHGSSTLEGRYNEDGRKDEILDDSSGEQGLVDIAEDRTGYQVNI